MKIRWNLLHKERGKNPSSQNNRNHTQNKQINQSRPITCGLDWNPNTGCVVTQAPHSWPPPPPPPSLSLSLFSSQFFSLSRLPQMIPLEKRRVLSENQIPRRRRRKSRSSGQQQLRKWQQRSIDQHPKFDGICSFINEIPTHVSPNSSESTQIPSFLPPKERKKERERERETDWRFSASSESRFWPRFWFQHWPTAELFHSVLPPPDSLGIDQDSCSSPFTDQDYSKDTLVASNPKKTKNKQ